VALDDPRADSGVRLIMLSEFRLECGDVTVQTSRTVQRLLAYLGLSVLQQRRAVVAGTLWPDVSEERAAGSLRSAIWRLEKLCPRLLRSHRDNIALGAHVQVDVHDFITFAHRLLAGRTDPQMILRTQPILWGELLPGWYEDWVLAERDRLRQLQLHAREELANQLMRQGNFAWALDVALSAVNAEPLRESAHRLVARVHLAEGNQAEAVHQYELFRCLIGHELGLSPTGEFLRLIQNSRAR
jgi:DNA-binding SARP family transcriptional activator